MRIFERPEFQRYASGETTHQTFDEREPLLASLTIDEIEELAVLFECGNADERQTAFGLIYLLTVREDPRLRSPAGKEVRHVIQKLLSHNTQEPDPEVIAEHALFEERFHADFAMRFATADGRALWIGPGAIDLSVRVGLGTLSTCFWDHSDEILLQLAVADAHGQVFEAPRGMRGDLFFRRFASNDGGSYSNDVPVIHNLRIWSDARERVPALGAVRGWGTIPFGYYLKGFGTRLDLLKQPGLWLPTPTGEVTRRSEDRLVLRVHPTATGGIGYRPTPEVYARVPSLAGIAFAPTEILGIKRYGGDPPLVFTATDSTGPPNANVRIE
jgi:hypothetical protein